MARERHFRVVNRTRDTVLAERCDKAAPFRRGIGLMGRASLPSGGGLIIQPCNSVVSFFMRFSIDVLFLDEKGKVLYLLKPLVPWRTSKIVRGSKLVVELPSGTIDHSQTEIGDLVEIQRVSGS